MKTKILTITASLVTIFLTAGCLKQKNDFAAVVRQIPDQTLFEQQMIAYSQLKDDPYLVINNFEQADQLENFVLTRDDEKSKGKSRIIYSGSPTATGQGALGIRFDGFGDHTLTLDPPIKRWNDFNLLLFAIYIDKPFLEFSAELIDENGKSSGQAFELTMGWNKVEFDLRKLKNTINLSKISKLVFHFTQFGNTHIFLDDLILVDHQKHFAGDPDGRYGSLFALEDGEKIRIGVCKRFEIVFEEGKLIAWYDLKNDRNRINNLLSENTPAIKFIKPQIDKDRLTFIESTVLPASSKGIEFKVTTYYDPPEKPNRKPAKVELYRIRQDGIILIDITTAVSDEGVEIEFAVDANQGFEPATGEQNNDLLHAQYALLSRAGKKAGADILIAVRPWLASHKEIKCEIKESSNENENLLKAVFSYNTTLNENRILAIMKVWPSNMDQPKIVEPVVKDFLRN